MEQKHLNILLKVDASFEQKAKYVFRTFGKILGLKINFFTASTLEPIHLYYGSYIEDSFPIHIYHDLSAPDFFSSNQPSPSYKFHLLKYKDEYIPMLFSRPGKLFRYTSNSIRLRKDIISSAFFFLTCWQEYASGKESSPSAPYNYQDSLQHKYGFAEIAPVDRYCEILKNMLKQTFPEIVIMNVWPEGKKFALSVSHNVEFWDFWSKEYIDEILQQKKTLQNKEQRNIYWNARFHKLIRPYSTSADHGFAKLIRKEKIYKFKASFFLITKTDFPDRRRNYFAQEKCLPKLEKLLKNGNVNLLGSEEAGSDPDILKQEWEKLTEFPAKGFRVRNLNAPYQKLFAILEEAKINFDSSLGFDVKTGFRAGISYPFQPYNLPEDRPFDILEIPLILDNSALQAEAGRNSTKTKKILKRMFKQTLEHHAHLSISWQSHKLYSSSFLSHRNLFWQFIGYAKLHNAWICSLEKLYNYWQNR
ncbi:MAG TPA: hypothetical protein PLD62_04810 [Candidatus Cloacimonadota bacterium]|nr:hypothetical protein [Candidatus Cloacimonadota bacterium]